MIIFSIIFLVQVSLFSYQFQMDIFAVYTVKHCYWKGFTKKNLHKKNDHVYGV